MDLSVLEKQALQEDNLIKDPTVGVETEVFWNQREFCHCSDRVTNSLTLRLSVGGQREGGFVFLTQANLFVWHSLRKRSRACVLWEVAFGDRWPYGDSVFTASTNSSAADARATQVGSVQASKHVAASASEVAAGILAAWCVSCQRVWKHW